MYRPPQKPLNVPQWGLVRIINDNLPVAMVPVTFPLLVKSGSGLQK